MAAAAELSYLTNRAADRSRLPDELLDAAKVDGATSLRTVVSVVLPIARPGMAVLGMLTFMAAWNGFFWPVIALNSANVVVSRCWAARSSAASSPGR